MDYAEIAPWFSKAERYMGVASTVQNRPSNPDGEYLPPMPWRCFDYILQKAGEKIGVPYLPDRCAQLTVAHNGRPACHYCGNCSRGCDVGSFFSPTWFTIPEAEATKKLTLLTDALVRSVLVDQDGMATGVAYVDRKTMKEIEVYGKVVVLAASCVETAHIMLNSRSRQWPTGIANSSGQLGRNLCDHLYGSPGYGYLPQLVGQPPTPDNIADSTVAWMPRWQNLTNPREEKFIRGYSIYMGGGCGEFPGHYRHLEGFGSEFKREIKRYYPPPIGALIQAPSLPSPTNYVDIDPDKKDIFGIPALRFHFEWGANELMMWEHSKQVMIDLFKAAGGELWGADTEPNRPGTSLHETGVCRFGNDPKTLRHEQVGADARCPEPVHLRCEHLPGIDGQDDHDADCRLRDAHLRSHARELQDRRAPTRLTTAACPDCLDRAAPWLSTPPSRPRADPPASPDARAGNTPAPRRRGAAPSRRR